MIFVKPKEGLRIRHPEKIEYVLPPEGIYINESTALNRMINDGDVVVVANPPQSETKRAAKKGDE